MRRCEGQIQGAKIQCRYETHRRVSPCDLQVKHESALCMGWDLHQGLPFRGEDGSPSELGPHNCFQQGHLGSFHTWPSPIDVCVYVCVPARACDLTEFQVSGAGVCLGPLFSDLTEAPGGCPGCGGQPQWWLQRCRLSSTADCVCRALLSPEEHCTQGSEGKPLPP